MPRPKPKSKRIVKSPLCVRITHCGHRAVLGKVEPWADGGGFQRRIWCCHCPHTGVESCNTSDHGGKVKGIIL